MKQKALALLRSNRLIEAKALLKQACKADRRDAEAWCLLGRINGILKNFAEMESCSRKAIRITPDYAEAHNNLGVALEAQGRLDEAIASYRHAVRAMPDYLNAHFNLGNALAAVGRPDQAAESYRRALQLNPDDAEIHNALGIALAAQGKTPDALMSFERALHIAPRYAAVYNNAGRAFMDTGQLDKAVASFEQASRLQPAAHTYDNLGLAYAKSNRFDRAIENYERAVELKPDFADAHNHLAGAFLNQGSVDKAIESFRHAMGIEPDHVAAQNLLLSLNYSGTDPMAIFREHVTWGERRILAHRSTASFANIPDPSRRLRIGYVSPDFRQHSVAFFFEAILASHDPDNVETLCYANVERPDCVTDRLRRIACHWRDIRRVADGEAAEMIRSDGIDILVDLAGHTSQNRLAVFALKPAPVQVTYLGYPNTTGLRAIDYRLTDTVADPPGQEAVHTEELVHLPRGFLCYAPPEAAPAISPLPAAERGCVTYGSFNHLAKMTHEVIRVWAGILQRAAGARLVLKNRSFQDSSVRDRYKALFAQEGITAERIDLLGFVPSSTDHLGLYHRIDIALDTFPYNGTTTTCEALWMGVPVITIAGNRHAGRVGASLLTRVGLTDLIADTQDEYVDVAVRLAHDVERLAALRTGLRGQLARSPVCDGKAFAEQLEEAYRNMWGRWCARVQDAAG